MHTHTKNASVTEIDDKMTKPPSICNANMIQYRPNVVCSIGNLKQMSKWNDIVSTMWYDWRCLEFGWMRRVHCFIWNHPSFGRNVFSRQNRGNCYWCHQNQYPDKAQYTEYDSLRIPIAFLFSVCKYFRWISNGIYLIDNGKWFNQSHNFFLVFFFNNTNNTQSERLNIHFWTFVWSTSIIWRIFFW